MAKTSISMQDRLRTAERNSGRIVWFLVTGGEVQTFLSRGCLKRKGTLRLNKSVQIHPGLGAEPRMFVYLMAEVQVQSEYCTCSPKTIMMIPAIFCSIQRLVSRTWPTADAVAPEATKLIENPTININEVRITVRLSASWRLFLQLLGKSRK